MFVSTLKKAALLGFISSMAVCGATHAASLSDVSTGTIPVTVTLNGVQASTGPIYVSVQTRAQYQGIKGYGAVLEKVTAGEMSTVIKIKDSGDYAVSVWHDLNNDGIFSMSESYQILDGWGGSGNVPTNRKPVFEDTKVSVGAGGADVAVAMIYPK